MLVVEVVEVVEATTANLRRGRRTLAVRRIDCSTIKAALMRMSS